MNRIHRTSAHSGSLLGALAALVVAVGAFALLGSGPALAQQPPEPAKPSAFGAEAPAPTPTAVAPGDLEGLLRNCDIVAKDNAKKLAACKQDATGVDFLAAAYLALWAILMVFFIMVRQRQKKLVLEMQTLRERLARLTDER